MDEKFIVDCDPAEVPLIAQIVEERGGRVETMTPRVVEPLTATIVVIVAIGSVAALQSVIETARGGQILDFRASAPRLAYRSTGLQYGLILVMTDSGSHSIRIHEPKLLLDHVVELVVTTFGAHPALAAGTQGSVGATLQSLLPEGTSLSASDHP